MEEDFPISSVADIDWMVPLGLRWLLLRKKKLLHTEKQERTDWL